MGQTCVCTNRIFVHESIFSRYVDKLAAAVDQLVLGNGLDEGVSQGPLVDMRAIQKILQEYGSLFSSQGVQLEEKIHQERRSRH